MPRAHTKGRNLVMFSLSIGSQRARRRTQPRHVGRTGAADCSGRTDQIQRYGCPATFTGTLLSVVVPSPSSPAKLSPQQYARPASVTPQVWWKPALRLANVRPPLTGTGSELELVESLPSGPPPQQ